MLRILSSSVVKRRGMTNRCQRFFSSKIKEGNQMQSFIMSIFGGDLQTNQVFPFPNPLTESEKNAVKEVVKNMRNIYEEHNPDRNDLEGKLSGKVMNSMWEIGAMTVQIPLEYGGLGFSNTQYMSLVQLNGLYDPAFAAMMGGHQHLAIKAMLLYGTSDQKKKYIGSICSDKEITAFAITEPTAGSDVNSLKTQAVLSADGKYYIINGTKSHILNAPRANIFVILAKVVEKEGTTSKEKPRLTALLVERNYEGVTTGLVDNWMGLKSVETSDIYLKDVYVPVENVLGGVGNGLKVAVNVLNAGRVSVTVCASGSQKFCIEKAVDFATKRKQFGTTIDNFGLIQEKLGRMAILHYVTESVSFMIAGNRDKGCTENHLESAAAKIFGTEASWWVCDEAIQILGSRGYLRSSQLERVMRDLRVYRIFEGTNEVLRLLIATQGIKYAASLRTEAKKQPDNIAKRRIELQVHSHLSDSARFCEESIQLIHSSVRKLLITNGDFILKQQILLSRLSDAIITAYTMAVVLSRCTDSLERDLPSAAHEKDMTNQWCYEASKRVEEDCRNLLSDTSHPSQQALADISKTICRNGGTLHKNPADV